MTAVHQFVPALLPRDATGDHTLRPARHLPGGRLGVGHLRRGGPRRAAGRGHLLRGVPGAGPAGRRAALPAGHLVAGGRVPARPSRAAGARLPQHHPGLVLRGLGGPHRRQGGAGPPAGGGPGPEGRAGHRRLGVQRRTSSPPWAARPPRWCRSWSTSTPRPAVDPASGPGWPEPTGRPPCCSSSGGSRPTRPTSGWWRRCTSTGGCTTPTPGSTWWARRSPRPTPRPSSPSPTSSAWPTPSATARA